MNDRLERLKVIEDAIQSTESSPILSNQKKNGLYKLFLTTLINELPEKGFSRKESLVMEKTQDNIHRLIKLIPKDEDFYDQLPKTIGKFLTKQIQTLRQEFSNLKSLASDKSIPTLEKEIAVLNQRLEQQLPYAKPSKLFTPVQHTSITLMFEDITNTKDELQRIISDHNKNNKKESLQETIIEKHSEKVLDNRVIEQLQALENEFSARASALNQNISEEKIPALKKDIETLNERFVEHRVKFDRLKSLFTENQQQRITQIFEKISAYATQLETILSKPDIGQEHRKNEINDETIPIAATVDISLNEPFNHHKNISPVTIQHIKAHSPSVQQPFTKPQAIDNTLLEEESNDGVILESWVVPSAPPLQLEDLQNDPNNMPIAVATAVPASSSSATMENIYSSHHSTHPMDPAILKNQMNPEAMARRLQENTDPITQVHCVLDILQTLLIQPQPNEDLIRSIKEAIDGNYMYLIGILSKHPKILGEMCAIYPNAIDYINAHIVLVPFDFSLLQNNLEFLQQCHPGTLAFILKQKNAQGKNGLDFSRSAKQPDSVDINALAAVFIKLEANVLVPLWLENAGAEVSSAYESWMKYPETANLLMEKIQSNASRLLQVRMLSSTNIYSQLQKLNAEKAETVRQRLWESMSQEQHDCFLRNNPGFLKRFNRITDFLTILETCSVDDQAHILQTQKDKNETYFGWILKQLGTEPQDLERVLALTAKFTPAIEANLWCISTYKTQKKVKNNNPGQPETIFVPYYEFLLKNYEEPSNQHYKNFMQFLCRCSSETFIRCVNYNMRKDDKMDLINQLYEHAEPNERAFIIKKIITAQHLSATQLTTLFRFSTSSYYRITPIFNALVEDPQSHSFLLNYINNLSTNQLKNTELRLILNILFDVSFKSLEKGYKNEIVSVLTKKLSLEQLEAACPDLATESHPRFIATYFAFIQAEKNPTKKLELLKNSKFLQRIYASPNKDIYLEKMQTIISNLSMQNRLSLIKDYVKMQDNCGYSLLLKSLIEKCVSIKNATSQDIATTDSEAISPETFLNAWLALYQENKPLSAEQALDCFISYYSNHRNVNQFIVNLKATIILKESGFSLKFPFSGSKPLTPEEQLLQKLEKLLSPSLKKEK